MRPFGQTSRIDTLFCSKVKQIFVVICIRSRCLGSSWGSSSPRGQPKISRSSKPYICLFRCISLADDTPNGIHGCRKPRAWTWEKLMNQVIMANDLCASPKAAKAYFCPFSLPIDNDSSPLDPNLTYNLFKGFINSQDRRLSSWKGYLAIAGIAKVTTSLFSDLFLDSNMACVPPGSLLTFIALEEYV